MTGRTLVLRTATEDDLSTVERLVAANDLPTADLDDTPATFSLAFDDGDDTAARGASAGPVGVGGLERHGDVALLRSVVVAEPHRGQGYGRALCAALESRAVDDGIRQLYLLTDTARGFFADQGYERVERSRVPDAIRETTEFTALCPSSATCMRKQLSETQSR